VFPAAGGSRAVDDGEGRVSIFYYPWYSTPARDGEWAHWYVERSGTAVLSTPYFPSRGLYSSSSAQVVAAQMQDIVAAGVDTVVVSWWGDGSPEAERLPLVTAEAHRFGLDVAIHLEPYPGRDPARAAADIERLHTEDGFTDFYVYDVERDPPEAWAAALAPLDGVRVFGNTTLVGRAKASGFDGVYTYDVLTWHGALFRRLCTQAHAAGLLCAPSVGPGYDARLTTDELTTLTRRNGATYDRMWRAAIGSSADLVSVTSYNEWQEGTQIEPAAETVPGGASGYGYGSYDGAWGLTGPTAETAYLGRTAQWARLFTTPGRSLNVVVPR
jgi:glycoprotein endo-alpha-1,2-mannosidase